MPRNIRRLDAGASGMIRKLGLIRPVRRAADQHEAPVAIAAIDIAVLVDLKEDARMAERRPAGNVGRAITGDTTMADAEDFRRCDHRERIAVRRGPHNSPISADWPPRAWRAP